MLEYTFFALASVVIVIIFDYISKTRLIWQKKFWIFQVVVFTLTLIFDNYAIIRGIYAYDDDQILGIYLLYAPLEDFFFAFSLITLNLILYERRLKKQ